ncbi:Uncharacterised protein [Mycobacterium tuberculosis]|nr:Uncharacterised protein [Mycobacterium tuberculosis]
MLIAEPISARLVAAAVIKSGDATTYNIVTSQEEPDWADSADSMAARDAHCGLRGNCLGLAAPRCTGLLAQEADVIVLTPVGITWERRSQGRNQPSGVRPSQNRRRADRCGHHERHAGGAAASARTELVNHPDRTAGRGSRRKQRSLEQRRHRALRAVRDELHPRNAGRLDRHHQSGACQRAIPGHPPVLGIRGRKRHPHRRAQLPQPCAAREFRPWIAGRRVSTAPPKGVGRQPAVRRHRVHRESRRIRPPAAVHGR